MEKSKPQKMKNICRTCGQKITMQCQMGTGFCCQNCTVQAPDIDKLITSVTRGKK